MIFRRKKTSTRATAALSASAAVDDDFAGFCASAAPSGMTLLEVLVACFILVLALAGIAAILPAAGSRLAESVAEDRAALMAANVYADLQESGVLTSTLFMASGSANLTATSTNARQLRSPTFGFGVTDIRVLNEADSAASKAAPDYFADKFSLFAGDREFFIQDEIEFVGDTLNSRYENGGVGPRAFKRGVCWGATLTASGTSINAGSQATLTIAIFKKPGEIRGIDLAEVSTGVPLYRLPAEFETIRSTFLKPCSYVLAIPPDKVAPPPPKWFRINSSWTQQSKNLAQRISYVSLPPEATTYTTPTGSGKQLLVIGFAGLIRVDEYPVVLK